MPRYTRLFTGLLLLLLSTPALGQSQRFSLDGTLENAKEDKVQLVLDPMMLGGGDTTEIPLSGGHFQAEFKGQAPMWATLVCGDLVQPLYLGEAGELRFTVDVSGYAEAEFDGTSAADNAFLAAFHKRYPEVFRPESWNDKLLAANVDLLELELYDRRDEQSAQLGKASDLSQGFQDLMALQIDYDYDHWLLTKAILTSEKDSRNTKVQHLPRTVEADLDIARLQKPEALMTPAYREYLWYGITYFTSRDRGFQKFFDANESVRAKLEFAEAHLEGPPLLWYTSRLLYMHADRLAPGTIQLLQERIRKADKSGAYVAASEARIEETAGDREARKQALAESTTEPTKNEPYPFRMEDLDGNPVKLSDFKGKVVYIDFWASWCGPCRGQMPYAEALKERVKLELSKKEQKKLVFLYISIDKDEESWRKGIQVMKIQGEHALSKATWQDGAGNFFQVRSIPRYMIMGKEGEIVDRNAKRPSQPEIFDDLVKYLRE